MFTRVFETIVIVAALTVAACSGTPPSSESGSTPSIPAPPDVAAAPADAIRTPTGLASKVLSPGTGTRHPRPNSQVVVHYTGWTTDGKMFDSSVTRGQPASFSLDGVIAGWTEGVQMMVVGEKRRFWIPAKLAYEGKDGPQGTLVFDIELIRIES
jgi:peptidylprolyl isomerase